MVRYDNLWEEFASFENFYLSFLEARSGRTKCSTVLRSMELTEWRLFKILKDLENGCLQFQSYFEFESIAEVKRRTIDAPTFRDRIIHHALHRVVNRLFEKKFIHDSYACRKGKGTHKAVERLQNFLRRAKAFADKSGKKVYVLQCDISKYYPSIDHGILKSEIRRTIADERLLQVWDSLIDSFETEGKPDVGIPIGALTSQLSANIYLNPFDHFVKDVLKVKYYIRYMDDFIVITDSKEELSNILQKATEFLENTLRLKLNPKTKIYPASRGVDFCGYRTFFFHRLPRKRNVKAARKRFKILSYEFNRGRIVLDDVRARVDSFVGYIEHCDGVFTAINTLLWIRLYGVPDGYFTEYYLIKGGKQLCLRAYWWTKQGLTAPTRQMLLPSKSGVSKRPMQTGVSCSKWTTPSTS